jgi:hypothetical protein
MRACKTTVVASGATVAMAVVVGCAVSGRLQSSAPVAVTVRLQEDTFSFPTGTLFERRFLTRSVRADGSYVEAAQRKAPDGRMVEQKIIVNTAVRLKVEQNQLVAGIE